MLTRIFGTGLQHRVRNGSLYLGAALFFAVVLPDGLTKGNKYVGGRDGFLAVCVVCGICFVIWLLATDTVWSRLTRSASHNLHVVFALPAHGYLQVGIRNDGSSMRDAVLNLLIPQRIGFLRRVDHHGKSIASGFRTETTEELEPGEPTIYWSESGLQIHGGGNSTLLYFQVGHRPGTYPVRLKLYDDSTTPRSFEVDDTFTIPQPEVNLDRRQRVLESVVRDLDFDRQEIVRALGTGLYPSSAFPWLRHRNSQQIRSHLAWNGRDEALCVELEETFGELQRLDELRIDLGDEAPKVRGEHRAEWTVACVLQALARAKAALS